MSTSHNGGTVKSTEGPECLVNFEQPQGKIKLMKILFGIISAKKRKENYLPSIVFHSKIVSSNSWFYVKRIVLIEGKRKEKYLRGQGVE